MSNFHFETDLTDVNLLKNQLTIAKEEIDNLRQQIKALKHIYRKDCDEIRDKLQNWQCLECKNRQTGATSVQSTSNVQNVDLPLNYIGTIFTHFPEKRGTPRQPGICPDMIAKIVLNNTFTNPEHSLEGLQEYSHMWILFHFHKNDSTHVRAKVAPPRLNGLRTGVFATRSPHRPCPIGLSLVKIDRIMDNTIYFTGVDMVDQTPVVDIKPYIPQYDNPMIPFHEPTLHLDQSLQDNLRLVSTPDSNEVNLLENLSSRVMDGEENERVQTVVGASSLSRTNFNVNMEETYHEPRSVSRIGEREAPDGEEEEASHTQPAGANGVQAQQRQIRVPNWIDQPPVSTLSVYFTQRAQFQLQQLGPEGEQKKTIIKNVLQEDPRSVYLRERQENTNYVFRIAELYVSCKFDDTSHTVRVFQIFQDSVGQGDE